MMLYSLKALASKVNNQFSKSFSLQMILMMMEMVFVMSMTRMMMVMAMMMNQTLLSMLQSRSQRMETEMVLGELLFLDIILV